jgi:hypothetical protein
MSRLLLVVLLVAVTVLSEASSIQPAHAENCANLFANTFKKDKHWKAFAENKKDKRGGYACGESYQYSTKVKRANLHSWNVVGGKENISGGSKALAASLL